MISMKTLRSLSLVALIAICMQTQAIPQSEFINIIKANAKPGLNAIKNDVAAAGAQLKKLGLEVLAGENKFLNKFKMPHSNLLNVNFNKCTLFDQNMLLLKAAILTGGACVVGGTIALIYKGPIEKNLTYKDMIIYGASSGLSLYLLILLDAQCNDYSLIV